MGAPTTTQVEAAATTPGDAPEDAWTWGPVIHFGPDDGSLADALWRFPAGADVRLAAGVYRGPLAFPERVRLQAAGGLGSVTVLGSHGATCSAEGAERVHLVNLILKGPSAGFGAVFQAYQQTDALLEGCMLTGGRGRGEGGGGVDLQAGRVRLLRCRLTQHAALQGGAARASGGVLLTARHCVFADNRAEGAGGGAVFASDGARVELFACTFSNNRGKRGSAVLATGRFGAEVAIDSCLFGQDEPGLIVAAEAGGRVALRYSVLPSVAAETSAGISVDDTVALRGVGIERAGAAPYRPSFPVILRAFGDRERFAPADQADLYGRPRDEVWVGAVA